MPLFSQQVLPDGYYRIKAKHSGKVFDIQYGSTSNGAHLIQWAWNGNNNQRFKFISNSKPIDGTTSSGTSCATKYPILLVHSVALADSTLGFHYFGRIPKTAAQPTLFSLKTRSRRYGQNIT